MTSMRRYACLTPLLSLLVAGACADSSPVEESGWQGTITADGDVTTVVNESGSVWGGTARLEERASIGVEEGEDPYLLGRIGGIWSDGEEIFVLDTQAPALRAYDGDGGFLREIGRPGQGPGELSTPGFLDGDRDGRLYVANYGTQRIEVFSRSGEYVDAWPMEGGFCCIHPVVVGTDGQVYVHVPDWSQDPYGLGMVMVPHGPNGRSGESLGPFELPVPDHSFRFQERRVPAPWAPRSTWALTSGGDVIVGGGHEYRFEIRSPNGTTTVVQRPVPPVEIDPEEREWQRRYTIAVFRRGQEGWSWDGGEMPDAKPYFERFLPTESGEVWVVRPGPGIRLPTCDPDASVDDHEAFQRASCYRDAEIVDVFGADGRFLGELEVPFEVNLRFAYPWVDGDTVIANVYDDDGVIRVVRYEIVYPSVDG